MLPKSHKVFGFPRPTNLIFGKCKGENYDPLVIQVHDIFSSMKTTNDFSLKGALQITDNLLILFVELDFMHGDDKSNTSIWLDEKKGLGGLLPPPKKKFN